MTENQMYHHLTNQIFALHMTMLGLFLILVGAIFSKKK